MTRKLIILIVLLAFFGCESYNKNKSNNVSDSSAKQVVDKKAKDFQETLIDYRKINEQFTDSYKVEGFGIQKRHDSIIGLVFKLNENTTKETVLNYSVGFRIFDKTLLEPKNMSFSPDLIEIGQSKYIVMERVIKDMTYFDSIWVYIYKRKDWKGSGRLGDFKVRDILFEEKNK
ncbi:hypothetical protein [Gaetbulibacter sp. PBL-D1]|uniref:hypothetical protein n=1 Tax=Gaetbulibacter sp. PBL-D1 TaxID=3422594 RepID=UPI003D2EE085